MAERAGRALAVGLMSGTSLDGVSAALVAITEDRGGRYRLDLLAFLTTPFSDPQREIGRASCRERVLACV